MSYWYRPNVFKRRWGSYGGIHNDYFNNYINDNYDPDNGEENYIESDDVDLHPDTYTADTFYDPDNEIERADRPSIDDDEDFSKTGESMIEDNEVYPHVNQIDTFDDPDIDEYESAGLMDIKTDDEEYNNEKEPLEGELPIYELINPSNPSDVLTYTDPVLKILEKAGVDTTDDTEVAKQLIEIRDVIRENNKQNIDNYIKAEEEGLVVNGSIIKDKTLLDIKEDDIPIIFEREEEPMEEIEFNKDDANPDRHIIPPRPPRERRPLKEWLDKYRDSNKRKHHLEERDYKIKRDYEDEEIKERKIAIEETKKEIDNNKEEIKEELIETQPEQKITREIEVEEEVDNWRDQDKIFKELKNQTSQFNKKEPNHKYINTNHIQEKVEELKKAIDEKDKDQDLKELNRLKRELANIKKSIDASHKLPLLMSKPSKTSKINHGDQKDPNYSKGIDKLVEQEEEDLRTSNNVTTSLDTLTLSDQQKYWNNFKHNDGIEGGNDVDLSNEVNLEGEEEQIEQEEEPEIEYEYEYEYEYE